MKLRNLLSIVIATLELLSFAAHARAAEGDTLRLPVTRDAYFSNVGQESHANLGGSSRLKLKSIQEMSLVDLDPAVLRGHAIRSAVLHVHDVGPEILRQVSVSTISAQWIEGTSDRYEPQAGSSSFAARREPDVPWSFPHSDLTSVMFTQGGTHWHGAKATPPDGDGWQMISVDPQLIGARVAGVSYGFVLFDDTGSEWTRKGEQFNLRIFPNRFVHSRESGEKTAPYFTVVLGMEDHAPPRIPTGVTFDTTNLPAGEARVEWTTPVDEGRSETVGFIVEVDDRRIPQYLVPFAGVPYERVTMHLRDLDLKPGQRINVAIRAVDGAGNESEPARLAGAVSDQKIEPLPGENAKPLEAKKGSALPKLGNAEIAIVDALDKVQPVTGEMTPKQEPAYLLANHLWDGKQLRLHAARNEFVSFQVLVHGTIHNLQPELIFAGSASPGVTLERFRYVQTKAGPMPDPLLPLEQGLSVPDAHDAIPGQQFGSLMCELYVPHDLAAGEHTGALVLRSDGQKLRIPISLTVWNFALPDRLSFLPEMNCYGLPDNERDYYRLAQVNRTVLNRVPYGQNGVVAPGCAPQWDDQTQKLDFTEWDKRFGPLFDGSAFADLPRKGVPIECFYLPIHENWPTPMEGNYNGSYWASEAFTKKYVQNFFSVSEDFARHIKQRGWNDTIFQCFFNGKNNFKAAGWSHGSSPWLLDEPANYQDFWALHYFGTLFRGGIQLVHDHSPKLLFRCDISRPQWQRNTLDEVLKYNVVAGDAFHRYHRLVMERKQRFGQYVIPYGSSNDPAASNLQPVAWCLDSWTLGGDGVLPWQTIGNAESWTRGQDTCLFYPGESIGRHGPIPSIRLKAYLRGEQDVEYLVLLSKQQKESQLIVGQRVRAALPLEGHRQGTGFTADEDAGVLIFDKLRPQDLWALRTRVGEALNAASRGKD